LSEVKHNFLKYRVRSLGTVEACSVAFLLAIAGIGLSGCGVFSSSFSSLLDGGTGAIATIENAPGHLVIAFVNSAEVDELLLSYLESADGGSLVLTEVERRQLRPRVRLRATVTFADGTPLAVEFASGSTKLVEPRFAATAQTELNQSDVTNSVVACDVNRVEVQVNTVEVFVPAEWRTFTFVDPTETMPGFLQEAGRDGPEFVPLQVDDVDATTLTATVQRNISIRDLPSPVDNPTCGAVVTIQLSGVMSVPFIASPDGVVPGFDVIDTNRAASLGGRFEFQVAIQ
jgi:hypothetical protein